MQDKRAGAIGGSSLPCRPTSTRTAPRWSTLPIGEGPRSRPRESRNRAHRRRDRIGRPWRRPCRTNSRPVGRTRGRGPRSVSKTGTAPHGVLRRPERSLSLCRVRSRLSAHPAAEPSLRLDPVSHRREAGESGRARLAASTPSRWRDAVLEWAVTGWCPGRQERGS